MADRIELKPGKTIVFTGDSITDTGRGVPAYAPFGYGYVNFTANGLLARYPQMDLNIINTGVSGNTIRGLKVRWHRDCLNHNPDIVSVMIGINDLWRQHVEPERRVEAVYPEEYETTYRQMLADARSRFENIQIVLMEPFMFCNDPSNPMLRGLPGYLDIVNRLSEEFDAVLVRLQGPINHLLNDVPAAKFSDDFVHPYIWAHAWISLQWFEAAGL